MTYDEVARANQRVWDNEVASGCGFTVPWLDLDVSVIRRYARGEIPALPEPATPMQPSWLLADVEGKDVLCLASGGGQQSAVFGLLGANVTVADFTEGQLQGDARAAEHYGYEVKLLKADMRDLSEVGDGAFDVVYQAESFCYVPSVRQVYGEVTRVLKPGGLYRAAHMQPATACVDWDGARYAVTKPYADDVIHRHDGGVEFRHYLDDVFGGLVAAGLSLVEVVDTGRNAAPDPAALPGTWAHQERYVGGGFVIVSRRVG